MKNVIFLSLILVAVSCGIPSAPEYHRYSPTNDTLMLGANDTFLVIDKSAKTFFFSDLYTYNVTCELTKVGDTTSSGVIMILQESNEFAGTNWYEVERDTGTMGTTLRLHGGSGTSLGYVKGDKFRILLDDLGGAGADSVLYNLDAVFKHE